MASHRVSPVVIQDRKKYFRLVSLKKVRPEDHAQLVVSLTNSHPSMEVNCAAHGQLLKVDVQGTWQV